MKAIQSGGFGKRGGKTCFMMSAALLALSVSESAFAQSVQSGNTEEPAAESKDIIVTGTSIRGVAPTGSNLIGVTRETIAANAPANASELLSSVPQLGNFGVNHEQATTGRFRTGGFLPNIHNIGIFATLTLFNGHRMAAVGGEAVLPDPGIVPVLAIERVEVVADGASAVYGSDAVAGVANFIYRKDMDGFEAQGTFGFSPNHSYEKRNMALGWGKKWASGSFMVVGEFSSNKAPTQEEFPWMRANKTDRGGSDERSRSCAAPNVRIGSTTYAYSGTPGGAITVGSNLCEANLLNTIIPESERFASIATFRQELNDTLELWAEANYSKLNTTAVANARNISSLIVPSTNPYFTLPAGVTATSVSVTRSGDGLFDRPVNVQASEVMGITAGLYIDLGNDWRGTVSTHYSKTNDYNSQPEIDLQAMERLVLGTTKATAFNPFGQAADNDPNVLKQINNGYTQINDTSQYLRQLSAKADGPLFSISGGDVRAAIGTEFREEQAQQLQLGGTPGPNQLLVRDDNIFRTVAAVFTEVNVPLFSDANAIPGFKRLDLSLSGRYDHYQKLGGTFNPKIGAIWVPFDSLSLRGSYGTSFVAPNIGMITSIFGVPQIATNVTGYFNGANLYNMGGGNPNLTPENATTYSLGADYKPAYIPGLKLGVTYYNVEYSNLVYKPTNTEAFNNPAFAYAVTKFSTAAGQAGATAAQIAAMVKEAPPQSPVPSRIDAIFRSYAVNIGVRKISGLDLDAAYAFGTGFGDFNISVNANRQLSYKQEVVPGSGFQSRLGFQDAIKWRARSQVSWKYDNLGISFFSTYIDSFQPIANIARVKAWTTFDLAAQYNFPNLLNGTQIQLRAANLFDKRPPFFNSGTGYYAQLASPFGQTLEVTLRTKF